MRLWESLEKRIGAWNPLYVRVILWIASAFISVYAVAAVSICIFVELLASGSWQTVLKSTPGWPWLAAFAGLAVTVPLCMGRLEGTAAAVALVFFLLLTVWLRRSMTRPLLEKCLLTAEIMSLPAAAVIVIQELLYGAKTGYRPASTFGNPNYYAAAAALVILFCLYRLLGKRGIRTRIGDALVLLANLFGLMLTGCRGALLALAAAVPVTLLVARRYRALGLTLAGIAGLLAVFFTLPQFLPHNVTMEGDVQDRLAIYLTALKSFWRSPLVGQGMLGYYHTAASLRGPVRMHAHNLLLDCLVNFGILGCGLFGMYFRGMLEGIRILQQQNTRLFALFCGGMTLLLLHGLVDVTLLQVHTGLLFSLLLCLPAVYENALSPAAAALRLRERREEML